MQNNRLTRPASSFNFIHCDAHDNGTHPSLSICGIRERENTECAAREIRFRPEGRAESGGSQINSTKWNFKEKYLSTSPEDEDVGGSCCCYVGRHKRGKPTRQRPRDIGSASQLLLAFRFNTLQIHFASFDTLQQKKGGLGGWGEYQRSAGLWHFS